MNNQTLTPLMQRKRKFLLFLPVLVLPFLTILFWSMKSKDERKGDLKANTARGLNIHLPDARLKDTGTADKLSFYEQADADARKLSEARQQDPYSRKLRDSTAKTGSLSFAAGQSQPGASLVTASPADANEQQIYQRLSKLQQAMNRGPEASISSRGTETGRRHPGAEPAAPNRPDPELQQMNSIMEKLVQIQHPDMVKPQYSATGAVNKRFRAIAAVIDGKQRITENTVVRMKLLDSVTISGQLFAKGQQVYAAGTFSNQRMKLDIKSIHIGSTIYPVDLTVFDAVDGLEGISVPEAVTGDALRSGASSGVQSMELMSLDPSVSAQLATAGVNTAKGLFSKKVKPVKAKLQDKRPVLLRINQPVTVSQDQLPSGSQHH